jgi:hypothetical protein
VGKVKIFPKENYFMIFPDQAKVNSWATVTEISRNGQPIVFSESDT